MAGFIGVRNGGRRSGGGVWVDGGGRGTESGWVTALELGRRMAGLGVARLLYTDIARDGMMMGPDLDISARLVRETGMAVLASGRVGSAEDIRSLASTGVEGGRALYTGAVGLAEAIAAVGG